MESVFPFILRFSGTDALPSVEIHTPSSWSSFWPFFSFRPVLCCLIFGLYHGSSGDKSLTGYQFFHGCTHNGPSQICSACFGKTALIFFTKIDLDLQIIVNGIQSAIIVYETICQCIKTGRIQFGAGPLEVHKALFELWRFDLKSELNSAVWIGS